MDVGASIGIAVAIIFVVGLVVGLVLRSSLYIVHQSEGIVIERFGKFRKVLGSGIHSIVPLVDRPRTFNWRVTAIDTDGSIRDEQRTGFRIDLRESVFNFMRQEVYTRDTVLLDVNALMFYRIVDIKKAIYEVDDLQAALSNTAQTQLKEVFGNLTFSDALRSQTEINEHLVAEFSKLFSGWGIHVERMELLDLTPKHSTREVMKKQMLAERHRRGEFIRSEGKKAAMRLQAEGIKAVAVNMGIAQQEATRKISEGESEARVELASAESRALETLAEIVRQDGSQHSQYMISQRYLDLFRQMTSSSASSAIFLPYDASLLRGIVRDLHKVYGPDAPANTSGAAPRVPAAGAAPRFAALD